ncbi:MAG: oxygenase MpaB family protein [Nannocystaceae bacterium]
MVAESCPSRVRRPEEARRRYGDLLDRLVPFLFREDPRADAVVAILAEQPAEARRTAISSVLRLPFEDHGPEWSALLEDAIAVPVWVDWEAIERAGVLFRRAGVLGGLVLGLRSLVYGYAAPAGNKPLALSGRLEASGAHRLAETGKFTSAVCAPDGMRVGAPGWCATLRVRLMHAQVRRLISTSARYDHAAWGRPINQHDMLSTILLFSTVFTEGLEMMGLRVSAREKEDYVQLWRYVAHVIGVDHELIPTSEIEARRYAELILLTQGPPDEDSKRLTRALLDGPLRAISKRDDRSMAVAHAQRNLAEGLCRGFLGASIADGLGLSKTPWRWTMPLLRPSIRSVEVLRQRSTLLSMVAEYLGTSYWDYAVRSGLREGVAHFELPTRLLRRG